MGWSSLIKPWIQENGTETDSGSHQGPASAGASGVPRLSALAGVCLASRAAGGGSCAGLDPLSRQGGAQSLADHPAGVTARQALAAGAAHQAAPPSRALVRGLGRVALYGVAGAGSAIRLGAYWR